MKQKTFILLLVVILVAFSLYLFKDQIFKVEKEKVSETGYVLSEEEIEKINNYQPEEKPKNGEYGFHVSSAPGVYPKFSEGVFSKRPKEVKGGEKLQASIKIEDPAGLQSVKFKIVAEPNFEKEMALAYDEKSGKWQGEISLPREVEEIVWTNFFAKNNAGQEDKLELAWGATNNCPLGIGNLDFSSLITASGCDIVVGLGDPNELVAGTQTGRITIGNKTVNLSGSAGKPAYLIFGTTDSNNRGVDLTGTGKIVLPVGDNNPTILIGYGRSDSVQGAPAKLCVYDVDGDRFLSPGQIAGRYPSSAAGCSSLGTGEEYREANTIVYPNYTGLIQKGDCDDTRSSVVPGACHWNLTTFPRTECDPNLTGIYVSSCGIGGVNCGEVCERLTRQRSSCLMTGIRYCVGNAGGCNPSGTCIGGPGLGCEVCCGNKCCAAGQICFNSGYYLYCCPVPPDPTLGPPYPLCEPAQGTCESICSGGYCCEGVCCPNGTSCVNGTCYSTNWSACGPLAFSSPDFRMAGMKCSTACTAGQSQSCQYSTQGEVECDLSCTAWGTNCVDGIQE